MDSKFYIHIYLYKHKVLIIQWCLSRSSRYSNIYSTGVSLLKDYINSFILFLEGSTK